MTEKPNYEDLEKRIRELEAEISNHKRTEELLQESEAGFRRMVNQVPELLYQFVMHKDGSFSVPFINDRAYEFFRYSPEEIMGEPVLIANNMHPEDKDLMRDNIMQSAKSLSGFSVEHRLLDQDKGIKWIQAKAIPHLMKDGNIHWDGISTDITEFKQAEKGLQQSQEYLRAIMNNTSDYIVIRDKNGFPVLFNSSAEKIAKKAMGIDLNSSMKPHKLLSDKKEVAFWDDLHERALKGDGFKIEYSYPVSDNDLRHFEIYFNPILQDGEVQGFIQVARDITERREMEDILKKSHDDLEHRVKERTEELRKANEALQEKTINLQEVNTALKVLLERREKDKDDIGQNVLLNVKELMLPYIIKLKKSPLTERQQSYLELLESSLQEIISPFAQKLTSRYMHITPGEMQVANLVKEGKTSKEIADILNSTERAVVAHRANLRKKLGLKKKSNLRTHLISLR